MTQNPEVDYVRNFELVLIEHNWSAQTELTRMLVRRIRYQQRASEVRFKAINYFRPVFKRLRRLARFHDHEKYQVEGACTKCTALNHRPVTWPCDHQRFSEDLRAVLGGELPGALTSNPKAYDLGLVKP